MNVRPLLSHNDTYLSSEIHFDKVDVDSTSYNVEVARS